MNTPFSHDDVKVKKIAGTYYDTDPILPKKIDNFENYKNDTYLVNTPAGKEEYLEGRAKPGVIAGTIAGIGAIVLAGALIFGGGGEEQQHDASPPTEIHQPAPNVIVQEDVTFINAFADHNAVTSTGLSGTLWIIKLDDGNGTIQRYFRNSADGRQYKEVNGIFEEVSNADELYMAVLYELQTATNITRADLDAFAALHGAGANLNQSSIPSAGNVEIREHEFLTMFNEQAQGYTLDGQTGILWQFEDENGLLHVFFRRDSDGVHLKKTASGAFTQHGYRVEEKFQSADIDEVFKQVMTGVGQNIAQNMSMTGATASLGTLDADTANTARLTALSIAPKGDEFNTASGIYKGRAIRRQIDQGRAHEIAGDIIDNDGKSIL